MNVRVVEVVRRALAELGARWDEELLRFVVETPQGPLSLRIGAVTGMIACSYDDPDRAFRAGVTKSNGKDTLLFDEHDAERAEEQVMDGLEWRIFGFDQAKARRRDRAAACRRR